MYKINIKLISGIIFLSIAISGCANKSKSNIKIFNNTYHHQNNKNLFINFKQVNDNRDVKIVSTIYKDKKVQEKFLVDVNLKKWYENAFTKEIKALNQNFKNKNLQIDLTVNIKKLQASYDKFTIKKDNMKANILIELIVKNKNITHTIDVELSQSMYKPLILDAQGFDSILNDIMKSSITKSISKLISKF